MTTIQFLFVFVFFCFSSQDARVPVCPLCNQPVPVNRGEDPNAKVSYCVQMYGTGIYIHTCLFFIQVNMHIQNECKNDKSNNVRAIIVYKNISTGTDSCVLWIRRYFAVQISNRCSVPGCKKKEVV